MTIDEAVSMCDRLKDIITLIQYKDVKMTKVTIAPIDWKLKQEKLSPQYTTDIKQIIKIKT